MALQIFSERSIAEQRYSDHTFPTRAQEVVFPESSFIYYCHNYIIKSGKANPADPCQFVTSNYGIYTLSKVCLHITL